MKGCLQEVRWSHSDFVFLLETFQARFFDMGYSYIHLETMPWIGWENGIFIGIHLISNVSNFK